MSKAKRELPEAMADLVGRDPRRTLHCATGGYKSSHEGAHILLSIRRPAGVRARALTLSDGGRPSA